MKGRESVKDLIQIVSGIAQSCCQAKNLCAASRGHFSFGLHGMHGVAICCILTSALVSMILHGTGLHCYGLVGRDCVEGIMLEASLSCIRAMLIDPLRVRSQAYSVTSTMRLPIHVMPFKGSLGNICPTNAAKRREFIVRSRSADYEVTVGLLAHVRVH